MRWRSRGTRSVSCFGDGRKLLHDVTAVCVLLHRYVAARDRQRPLSPAPVVGRLIVRRQRREWVGAPQKEFAWWLGFGLVLLGLTACSAAPVSAGGANTVEVGDETILIDVRAAEETRGGRRSRMVRFLVVHEGIPWLRDCRGRLGAGALRH